MPDRPILVTAALPYANGPLHLGHLAGAYLPADLYVRYLRQKGRDVAFICGSDEHGVAILIRAMQEGTTPQAIVDRFDAELRQAFERMEITFDFYGRTTSDEHRRTSQSFFRALDDAGTFTRKTERQLFDPEAGLFLADRFVKGTCPVCGYPEAYGDQCENCGSALSPADLIEPRSTLSGAVPVERETTHWYLPLGDWQPVLEEWIAGRREWKPNVVGQIRSWFESGLSDRAMTRDLPWGVPVPTADGGEVDGKVLYVWFDAPIGYVSATKEWAAGLNEPELWRRYWQVIPGGTEPALVHFIGKDNIVFHTLIFPTLLMAHNRANDAAGLTERWVLPVDVPANEFLNLEGRKLSTSRGWAVWAGEAADAFPVDELRYALATMLPETKDADFSWAEFQSRVNELADVVGNFVHRAVTFARRFAGGEMPPLRDPSDADSAAMTALAEAPARVGALYEAFRFREAVFETVALARVGNKYFNDAEPWKTRTTDPQAALNAIHVALQLCAGLAVLLEPITPAAAAMLRATLRMPGIRASTPGDRLGEAEGIGWDDAGRPLLPDGHAVGEPAVLFPKVEDEAVAAQRELLEARSAAAAADEAQAESPADGEPAPTPYAPAGDEVGIDQFAPLDLRVGRIVAAEPHPKADRLLRFDVDMGYETRQILSGVREHVTPEEMIGRHVVVVANLAPRTIRGLESRGMILYAENRDGRLVPVVTEGEPGAVVK